MAVFPKDFQLVRYIKNDYEKDNIIFSKISL